MEGTSGVKRKLFAQNQSDNELDGEDSNEECRKGMYDVETGNGCCGDGEEYGSMDEAFDKAVEEYCVDDIDKDLVMQMKFPSENDAELFYNAYAKAAGFSIRKSDFKMYTDVIVKYRKWVCACEGFREKKWSNMLNRRREPKPVTRTGCKALFRIKLVPEDGVYKVTAFVKEHNHAMADKSSVQFLKSHRRISDAEYAEAKSLRQIGVRISQIMKLFVLKAGGYQNIRFLLKDLYNKMNREMNKEIADGDAEAAIAYLAGKQVNDPMFFYKYKVDDANRLSILFWADSRSRRDYDCFGDVLVFDSTYKTNEYGKPLVVMAGVNNHFQTVIYACVLVPEENTETYEWVLETFVSAMNGKKPAAVLTDGDRAMRKAIKKVFPEAKHRLCCWHFRRNALSGTKCKKFLLGLNKCIYNNISEKEFEEQWAELVDECGLHDNEWVNTAYRRRHLWATAYLRGHFFAGMKSTQRCEKMNDVLKIHLKKTMRLFEFVQAFDLGISCLRHQEALQHKETEHTTLLTATIYESLERNAMEVYTRRIFLMVREELSSSSLFNPLKVGIVGQLKVYLLTKYGAPNSRWKVVLNPVNMEIKCACMTFESIGLPCAHMFKVMELEHMRTIPKSCILKRWSRNIRSEVNDLGCDSDRVISKTTQLARYGNLYSKCEIMCYYASQTSEGYNRIHEMVQKETTQLRDDWESNERIQRQSVETRNASDDRRLYGVKDPTYTTAKGDHKHSKKTKQLHNKCGKCGSRDGHNKRTCSKMRSSNPLAFDEGCTLNTDDIGGDYSDMEYNRQQDRGFDLNLPYLDDQNSTDDQRSTVGQQRGYGTNHRDTIYANMQIRDNESIYSIYEPLQGDWLDDEDTDASQQ